jgi:NADPH-dependent curcumin reductase
VVGFGGWQERYVATPAELRVLPESALPPSVHLGASGMPGLTAWGCLVEVASLRPGETVVLPAASGPVGLLAGWRRRSSRLGRG